MSILQYDSGPTSNDLLRSLAAKHSPPDLNYRIIAQSAEDVQNVENAPAVSMGPFLLKSGQTSLLTTISIYSLRGENRQQLRLLYMNAAAIQVWKEMGKAPNVIGARNRPPHAALLTFGVPFSE
jgi:hypothetical protein